MDTKQLLIARGIWEQTQEKLKKTHERINTGLYHEKKEVREAASDALYNQIFLYERHRSLEPTREDIFDVTLRMALNLFLDVNKHAEDITLKIDAISV